MYPAFNASRAEDAIKFAHEFGEVLASRIALEAVIRVRASRGLLRLPSPPRFTMCSWLIGSIPFLPALGSQG
jgi:protein transport protein SEC24